MIGDQDLQFLEISYLNILVKVSDSLVNGAFGAIGANGDNKWRQWMLHCRQWRHPLATMAIAIDDHWRHLNGAI